MSFRLASISHPATADLLLIHPPSYILCSFTKCTYRRCCVLHFLSPTRNICITTVSGDHSHDYNQHSHDYEQADPKPATSPAPTPTYPFSVGPPGPSGECEDKKLQQIITEKGNNPDLLLSADAIRQAAEQELGGKWQVNTV